MLLCASQSLGNGHALDGEIVLRTIGSPELGGRPGMVLASPLGRQMLASYVDWKESICDASPGYHELARSWTGSQLGLLDHFLIREWRNISADLVRRAFRHAVMDTSDWRWRIAEASERQLIEDLASATGDRGFNLENEAVWGLTHIGAAELAPVAVALVSAAGAGQWWNSVSLTDQRFVGWDDRPPLRGADLESTVEAASRELRSSNGGRGPNADWRSSNYGSLWWSSPSFAEESWTVNRVAGIWSTGLLYFTDAYGPGDDPDRLIASPASPGLWQLSMDPSARIYEVSGPADWAALVNRFPCDVSRTHGDDWSRWSGAPGPWILPDWSKVAESYDGVHVSIGGYISSCGLGIPVHDGYSMLAGWLPGATLWLKDVIVTVTQLTGRQLS